MITTFPDLAIQIFRDEGPVDWDDLGLGDRRRLMAAYLRMRPLAVEDVFAALQPASAANHIAALLEGDECDVLEFAREIRDAALNKYLAADIDAELSSQYGRYERIRKAELAEAQIDAEREDFLLRRQAG